MDGRLVLLPGCEAAGGDPLGANSPKPLSLDASDSRWWVPIVRRTFSALRHCPTR